MQCPEPGLEGNSDPSCPGAESQPLLPEVLRCQHLIVVEEFALGARAVQGRQDILHHIAREGMHLPLEQIDAGPPGHVGALKQQPHLRLWSSWEQSPLVNLPTSHPSSKCLPKPSFLPLHCHPKIPGT